MIVSSSGLPTNARLPEIPLLSNAAAEPVETSIAVPAPAIRSGAGLCDPDSGAVTSNIVSVPLPALEGPQLFAAST